MNSGLEAAIKQLWPILKPKDNLTVTEWAERKRYIGRGKYRSDVAPYQCGPMDAATDPTVREIVFLAAAQIGKTTIIENIIGYFIDHEPRLALVVQPTLEMAQTWSTNRLTTMARESFPGVLAAQKSRDTRNTMLAKTYPGGDIAIVGANAPAGVASRDRNLVALDETCRYPDSVGSEGDIEVLAIKRTESYPDALVIRTSTPTIARRILGPDGEPVILPSRIFRSFNVSDKREWFCKCPRCEVSQTLKLANVKWDEGKPETARYVCESCKAELTEYERRKMAKSGEWKATAPFTGIAGFRINAFASPFDAPRGFTSKLHQLACKWIDAKGDKEKLKAFINVELAEDFIDYGTLPDTKSIFNRRESFDLQRLPDEILSITVGVDVQGDRLEMTIVGWGEGEECWILAHHVLPGSTQKPQVWADLDLELGRRFKTASGHEIPIHCALIDSGDGKAQDMVYKFVRPRQGRKIFASKGDGRIGHPIVDVKRPGNFAKKREPIHLAHIGVDVAKDTIFERAKLTDVGPRYIHFSDSLSVEWFNQFASEEKQTRVVDGRPTDRWVQARARNEALDCVVMALAGLYIIRPRWDALKEKRGTLNKPEAIKAPEPEEQKQHPLAGQISAPRPKPIVKRQAVSRFANWRG